MLCLEEETLPNKRVSYDTEDFRNKFSRIQKYEVAEIDYHIGQCQQSGFFLDFKTTMIGIWSIADITPKAHEFLANIREDTIWNGVKSVAAKIGSKSMDAVVQIASNVVSELIRAQFGLPASPK